MFRRVHWAVAPGSSAESVIELAREMFWMHPCPLCSSQDIELHFTDRVRSYYLCMGCALLFVQSADYLSAREEQAEYDLHENSPDDPRYRNFLSQLFEPVLAMISPGSYGLDFGSGPGPTLSCMFEEVGHSMSLFDIFYANQPKVFEQRYDFITATEVVEHLHKPLIELDRLWSCLQPGGVLGVMTQLWSEQFDLHRWRYKDDRTHVCFFSSETFEWLARRWDAELHEVSRNVRIFRKNQKEK